MGDWDAGLVEAAADAYRRAACATTAKEYIEADRTAQTMLARVFGLSGRERSWVAAFARESGDPGPVFDEAVELGASPG